MRPQSHTPLAAPALPKIFGRYLLLARLSRGGMGEIFLARHGLSGFEKLVVIKKVLPHLAADEAFLARFIDEAQVAVKLQHANIAQVFEVGRVGDEYFLALEHVDGRDLRRTLAVLQEHRRGLPVDLALLVARDVANGLSYAHRRTGAGGDSLELVHCDVSPPNIMMSFEGETKLIDFGIAKSALKASATDPKSGFGKFGYMSPEQLIRGMTVDFRTDIYATGVVLYEMLTGRRLYDAGDTPDYRELARMVTKGQHALPSHHDPSLAPYDPLVVRALRPDPGERYGSAAELRDAIQEKLVAVNPTVSPDQLGAFMRELFTGEVTQQQRELAEVDLTDLDHWQQELDAAAGETVSIAFANLPPPLPAPSAPVERAPAPSHTRRLGLIAAAGLAAGIAAAGLGVALTRTGGAGDPAASTPAVAGLRQEPPAVEPIVEPLAPKEPAGTATGAAEPGGELEVEAEVEKPAPAAPDRARRARAARDDKKEEARSGATDVAELERRFQSVSREYSRFRKRFGSRLEQEWNDLTHAVTFGRKADRLRDLDRQIQRFRAKMRQVEREGG